MSGAAASPPVTQVGKVALRIEGVWWVAYYDIQHADQPKVELARIHTNAIEINPARREQFTTLARDLCADLIEKATGIRPIFGGLQLAPESERAGHG